MTKLGSMYFEGCDIPRDYTQARRLFEKALTKGDHDCVDDLAKIYVKGLGCPIDIPKALSMWSTAYQQTKNEKYLNKIRNLLHRGVDRNNIAKEYVRLWQDSQELPLLKRRVEELEAELAYQPDGIGYHIAKEDFEACPKVKQQ